MLSTIFQLYQDDGRVLMNSVCNGNLFIVEKISAVSGTRMQLNRPAVWGYPPSYRDLTWISRAEDLNLKSTHGLYQNSL